MCKHKFQIMLFFFCDGLGPFLLLSYERVSVIKKVFFSLKLKTKQKRESHKQKYIHGVLRCVIRLQKSDFVFMIRNFSGY